MPAFLKQDVEADLLYVELGGMQGSTFQDALTRVKMVPGRRFNGTLKRWELPNDAATALRVVQMLEPVTEPAVQRMIREEADKVAEQLVTRIGDDAPLMHVPWAERLWPYQRAGVDWLAEHPSALLADEMGLGKTVQAISAAVEFRRRNPSLVEGTQGVLVICPKAVRGTWAHEFEDWAGIEVQVIDGRTPKKRLEQLDADAAAYVINWESFWRDPVHPALKRRKWGAIIADEAHRAKNRKSKQSKGLRALHAPMQLALTGTPVMNSPDELWSLLAWLHPEQYATHKPGGGFWPFHHSYVDEYPNGRYGHVMVGVKNPEALQFELSDKMIRRIKKDVLEDLPEKMPSQVIEVELSPAERKVYEQAEKALFLDIAAMVEQEWEEATATEGYSRETWVEQRIEALSHMPLDKLTGLVPNAGARLAKLRQITAAAKVVVAEELIREEPETPVVAFTWHVAAAQQLCEALTKGRPRMKVGRIAGDDDADPVRDDFQAGRLDHVVCTIAKGGTGLTLTRSSNPILVEEDWVPAMTDQAIDRTHRIGQTSVVTPRVLRCVGTIDDGHIAPTLAFKTRITEAILGG